MSAPQVGFKARVVSCSRESLACLLSAASLGRLSPIPRLAGSAPKTPPLPKRDSGIDGTIHRTVARRRLAGPGPRGWSITLLSRKGGAGKTRGVPNPGRYHPRDLMRVPIDEKMRPLRAPERYPGRDFPDSQILSGSPITITKNTAVL